MASALLPARLAQLLVAYTIECDNLFEEQMATVGFTEYGLSLVTWLNFLQYLDPQEPVPISLIMEQTCVTEAQAAQIAAKLEGWFVIELETAKGRGEDRDGWATSKRITASSRVSLTTQGLVALEAWPSAIGEVEKRWKKRWRAHDPQLRGDLAHFIGGSDVALPDGVPSGWMRGDWRQFSSGRPKTTKAAPMGVLLSQAVLRAAVLFERRCDLPIALGANLVRVLDAESRTVAELAARCGLPTQVLSVQCTEARNRNLAEQEAVNKKAFRVTDDGRRAQKIYASTIANVHDEIAQAAAEVATAVESMLSDSERLRQGLIPSSGVARGGAPSPPLGLGTEISRRRGQPARLGAAGVTRNKELVAQTEAFLEAPAASLPHYPVWDQNRGFGP